MESERGDMNCELTLKDCEMDEGAKKTIKDKINALLDVSPSDAGASSHITKTITGYFGVLQVFSSQGKFITEVTGRNFDALIKSLFRLMYQKMKIWRYHRFLIQ